MWNLSCLTNIPPDKLLFINGLLSIAISDDLSAEDLNVLGSFISALGSLLLMKAAELSAQQTKDDVKQQICELEKQIKGLKSKVLTN